MRPYCLVLDSSIPQPILEQLATFTELIDEETARDTAKMSQVKAIAASPMTGVADKWFDLLPNLQIIAVNGVGTDRINLNKARERAVDVTTTLHILTEDVADLAFALLLALTRHVVSSDQFIRAGRWAKGDTVLFGSSLRGKKLGVVGLGSIGHAIATRGEAFGMIPRYYNRTVKINIRWPHFTDVVALAEDSDVLILAISATPQTHGMVNNKVLTALGKDGILINIARGSIVNEDDLIAALASKKIAGAGLDVFVDEPTINENFLRLENTVLTPHQGSATIETRYRMGKNVLDSIKAVLSGDKPDNIVN